MLEGIFWRATASSLLEFLRFLPSYFYRKVLKGGGGFLNFRRRSIWHLRFRQGQSFRPSTHFGIALLAFLAIIGGTVFGPLPSLAAQRSNTSEVVSPVTSTVTEIPAGRPRAATIEDIVGAGESVSSVAAKYGVSADTIRWANGLTSDQLNKGQKIFVPPVSGVVVIVGKGETLAKIAADHGVTSQDISVFPFNDIREDGSVEEGQIIVVPNGRPTEIVHPAPPPVAPNRPISYQPRVSIQPIRSYFASIGDAYPFGQCTYYIASRRSIPWLDNAGGWYRDAIAAGFAVGRTPRPGAIMVSFEGNPLGHVSLVERVNPDGSWVVSEMNYYGVHGGGWGRVDHRTVYPGTVFVVGFIY